MYYPCMNLLSTKPLQFEMGHTTYGWVPFHTTSTLCRAMEFSTAISPSFPFQNFDSLINSIIKYGSLCTIPKSLCIMKMMRFSFLTTLLDKELILSTFRLDDLVLVSEVR